MTFIDLFEDERLIIAARMLEKGMSIENIKACTKIPDDLVAYLLENFKEILSK